MSSPKRPNHVNRAGRANHSNRMNCTNRGCRGQGLIEATLVLLVFFALLIGVLDCGQVLYAHQALVDRVGNAVRWGTLHPYDGTGQQIANLVLYDHPESPRPNEHGYFGLTRANVDVRFHPRSADRPDDEILSVAIVNYESHFFSPYIARTIVSPRPILISAPMMTSPVVAPRTVN